MTGARIITALTLALLVASVVPSTIGQSPSDVPNPLLSFEVETPDGTSAQSVVTFSTRLPLVVTDTSRDQFPPPDVLPDGGQPTQQHRYKISITPAYNDTGWTVKAKPPEFLLNPGQSYQTSIEFIPGAQSVLPYYPVTVNITAQGELAGDSFSVELDMVGHVLDANALGALVLDGKESQTASPDEMVTYEIEFLNLGKDRRAFQVDVVGNTCGLLIATNSFVLEGNERRAIPVTVQAPAEKLYYAQETCPFTIVARSDDGGISKSVPLSLKVQGTYVDPGWIINAVIVLAVIALIIWLILLAKRRAEEEVLGKPQPPWTLPAEQVYLAELQKKDPQAAYVVRHFLMEDEYASSLMWYKAYKKATKGRRKAERKALKIEHGFEKWDLRMQAHVAKQVDTEKQVAKLQANLDRKSKKAHKKELKQWKKQISKLETTAANDHNKAMNEYRKAAKKAAKKGESAPKQPVMAHPELPPEPQFESIDVDTHPRGSRKKQRILDRASQNEARAEANYERLRAKKLDVTQRKLAKLAEAIDDPAFVDEHPMLRDAVSASA